MTFSTLRSILILILLLVAAACALLGGPASAVDVALIRAGIAARAATPLATDLGVFLNFAGGIAVTLGLAAIGSMMLWFGGTPRRAAWFGGIVLTGRLVIEAIKLLVDRARPALDAHPVVTHSMSFPSAHAGNSMIAFMAAALFFAPLVQRRRAVLAALFATLLIGASRSLLGVHWPSDVIAGWAIGAVWILAWWPIAERLTGKAQHDVVGGHRPARIQH